MFAAHATGYASSRVALEWPGNADISDVGSGEKVHSE